MDEPIFIRKLRIIADVLAPVAGESVLVVDIHIGSLHDQPDSGLTRASQTVFGVDLALVPVDI